MLWHFVKIIYSAIPKPNAELFRTQTATQNLLGTRMLLAPPSANDSAEDKSQYANELSADETIASDFVVPEISEYNKMLVVQPNNTGSATIDALNNIVYGDIELTVDNMDCIKSLRNGFLYIGPHDLTKNLSWPSDTMMNHDIQQNSRTHTMSRERHETSPVGFSNTSSKQNTAAAAVGGVRRCKTVIFMQPIFFSTSLSNRTAVPTC